uniref:AAA family ATPase n=1 Tax=Streptomyces polyasparticus TaxID=2767826 RepID=UPI001F310539|nr:AAA family ATPase [Streptomyces polyasparticus]
MRGPSASGKSSVAQGIRDRFGRGLALVGQDYLRRIVLRERDVKGGLNVGLIDQVARYTLDTAGYHTVIEGIFAADRYGDMLTQLLADHRGRSYAYYFDIPLAETLARHATKDREYLAHVTEEHLADWYRPRDLLPGRVETVIGPDSTLEDIVDQIMRDTGLDQLPALDP